VPQSGPAGTGPGRSGNPAGKSKGRARFEEAFNEALITQGSSEEAAQLLWQIRIRWIRRHRISEVVGNLKKTGSPDMAARTTQLQNRRCNLAPPGEGRF
jgi:hypothetical protein